MMFLQGIFNFKEKETCTWFFINIYKLKYFLWDSHIKFYYIIFIIIMKYIYRYFWPKRMLWKLCKKQMGMKGVHYTSVSETNFV